MKRGTALTCALMIVMMNTPAASAERNIVSTIRGADYAISVDADVYGEGTSGLQAYRVQTLVGGGIRRSISTFRCGLMQTCRQKKRTRLHRFLSEGRRNAARRTRRSEVQPIRRILYARDGCAADVSA